MTNKNILIYLLYLKHVSEVCVFLTTVALRKRKRKDKEMTMSVPDI
jgi:hypothetical protein